jgi:hypothetical protein
MRVWLDDKRKMPDGFDVHCWTADQCIEYLSRQKVSLISFDHDLGGEKTGYDVARWIEEAVYGGRMSVPEWRVHSANPVGAVNILMAMRSAERFQLRNEQAAQ